MEILVEDKFAKSLLTEILRQRFPELISSIGIHPVGDATAVRQLTEYLIDAGHRAIAIRDADQGENKSTKLFKFPGTLPPEKEVFLTSEVQNELGSKYNIDVREILSVADLDHHKYSEYLSLKAHCPKEVLENQAIVEYIRTKGEGFFAELVSIIGSELH
ncbi:hypothetical protein [Mucilaginibacter pedocola]|nr:hypothetical protein [Mucilaginibacter pedocola]